MALRNRTPTRTTETFMQHKDTNVCVRAHGGTHARTHARTLARAQTREQTNKTNKTKQTKQTKQNEPKLTKTNQNKQTKTNQNKQTKTRNKPKQNKPNKHAHARCRCCRVGVGTCAERLCLRVVASREIGVETYGCSVNRIAGEKVAPAGGVEVRHAAIVRLPDGGGRTLTAFNGGDLDIALVAGVGVRRAQRVSCTRPRWQHSAPRGSRHTMHS